MKPGDLARRKLIDRLVPRPEDGPLLGFVATTYEFQTEFFELDFLPSLLGIGAWDDRSTASRVLLEKTLAGMEAACVCVDARRYRGRPQSLRVSIVPVVAAPGAVFHPKVLLLVYEAKVKLLVGSANLTSPGYRSNREAVSLLEVSAKKDEQAGLVRAAVEGLARVLAPWRSDATSRVIDAALARVPARPSEAEWFVWSGPGSPLWEQFLDRWPAGQPIERIRIVSPFWSEEDGGGPLEQLLSRLQGKGLLADGAALDLFTDARASHTGELRPVLPVSFERFSPRRFGVTAKAHAVDPAVLPDEVDGQESPAGARALHAKIVLLEGTGHVLGYLGSGNFSAHGWGFAANPNVEAGLVLLRAGRERAELTRLIPATIGRPVDLAGAAEGKLVLPDAPEMAGPWPAFLREVLLTPSRTAPDVLELEVRLDPDLVEGPFSLRLPLPPRTTLWSTDVGAASESMRVGLAAETLEALLREKEVAVRWWATEGEVRFPVNVSLAARDELPLAPGAARLGESVLLAYYQGRIRWEDLFQEEAGPATGDGAPAAATAVDTSRIQSYQIREFVEALGGLKDELRAAAAAPMTMRLALLGPVSPVALARHVREAVQSGVRTPVAGAFQLVEIAACLREAMKYARDEKLRADWQALVARALGEVSRLLADLRAAHERELPASFASYEQALDAYHRGEEDRT